MKSFTGKVAGLKRRGNTKYGNPKWEVLLRNDTTTFRTLLGDDMSLAGKIDNREYAEADHTFGMNLDGTMDGTVEQ